MYGILIFFHLLVSVVLVLVVLVQQPQKGGMASIMGGSGDSMFGGSGAAPFMAKVTTVLAIAFMVTSLSLVLVSARLARPAATPRPTPAQPTPAQPSQPQPSPIGGQ
jgi:preprotein translocase subunit SecG